MALATIILAAGQGTRMKSALHKVLHPIAGRPMLLHLLASVEGLSPERRVVVVGAGRDQVEAAVAGKGVDIAVQAWAKAGDANDLKAEILQRASTALEAAASAA